jgi:glycosyltransferase involved in cell wall biosynthesis
MGHRVDLITLIKYRDDDVGGISLNAADKWSYLTKIWKLKSLLRELNPDILHSHYASSFGFLASFIGHRKKILSVWGEDIVEFPERSNLHRAIIKKSLNASYVITATSEFLKDRVRQFVRIDQLLHVIPFGVDTRLFRYICNKDRSTAVIGIAKGLRMKYGHATLLDAARLLVEKNYDIRIQIIGSGRDDNWLRRKASDLNLDAYVSFRGVIPHEELPAALRELDIFVMPSECEEGFGVAALEASSTGLPVVATRVGGVPEVVMDNKTGFLVERENVKELAEALERLIVDPDLREKMGRAGRAYVEDNYRWESNLKEMSDLYMKVMR